MPCLNVREAIRALKCKTTKLKTLFLCHFVPTALKQMHMEAVFSLSLLSCRSINITSKSVAAAWGGGLCWTKMICQLDKKTVSTPETCPHRTCFLFSCFVMERTACWHQSGASFEPWDVEAKKITSSAGDTLLCKTHSRELAFRAQDVWTRLRLWGKCHNLVDEPKNYMFIWILHKAAVLVDVCK